MQWTGMVPLMSRAMAREAVLDNLRLLAEWLRVKRPGRSFELVIAGGAALALLDIQRTTFDVDVLFPDTLPTDLLEGAGVVARAKGLGPDWLSTGVARALRAARGKRRLPDYFGERA